MADDPLTRYAQELNCSREEVRIAWSNFVNNVICQHIVKDRLTREIEKQRNTLETVKPNDLTETQGTIKGLKIASALIAKEEA